MHLLQVVVVLRSYILSRNSLSNVRVVIIFEGQILRHWWQWHCMIHLLVVWIEPSFSHLSFNSFLFSKGFQLFFFNFFLLFVTLNTAISHWYTETNNQCNTHIHADRTGIAGIFIIITANCIQSNFTNFVDSIQLVSN